MAEASAWTTFLAGVLRVDLAISRTPMGARRPLSPNMGSSSTLCTWHCAASWLRMYTALLHCCTLERNSGCGARPRIRVQRGFEARALGLSEASRHGHGVAAHWKGAPAAAHGPVKGCTRL